MAIYRMDLDRPAVLQLVGGTALLGALLFFAGTVVGYRAAAAPPAEDRPELPGAGEVAGVAEAAAPEAEPRRSAITMTGHETTADDLRVRPQAEPRPAEAPARGDPALWPATQAILAGGGGGLRASADGPWAVEIGAFSVRGNADALAGALRDRGYDPLVVSARSRTGEWLEHVRLSIHGDERQAQLAAGEFTLREQLPAAVVAVADEGAGGS